MTSGHESNVSDDAVADVDIAEVTDAVPALPQLVEPRDGVPAVVDTAAGLDRTIDALRSGRGPIAIDAERAGGYRYSQRAYLLQFRREGSGIHLVDPIAIPDLARLAEALADEEWVIHAASQDLPCLRELGLIPTRLFDTELAGRLLGYPKVALSTLLEQFCGVSLAKEHSAADWSTRPLPEPWLRYAALDVELLLELRDLLEAELIATNKWDWAQQEFAAAAAALPPPPRDEPWRRTSGLHRVRQPRSLAVVRSLWEARDDVARRRDSAPGRVLVDAAIITAAMSLPESPDALMSLPGWGGRGARRNTDTWWRAISAARDLPESELPTHTRLTAGPPPPRAWPDRDPAAAARLAACRETLATIGKRVTIPVENLLTPDAVRRLCWEPPEDVSPQGVEEFLRAAGARKWQIDLTAEPISAALVAIPPVGEAMSDNSVTVG